ncbi:MAG: hypothetical protein ABUL65_04915, partial [Opitutus sp.]
MKILAAFLCVVFAAGIAHAQVSPAPKPLDSKTPPAKAADPKAAPVKATDAKTADAKAADPKADPAKKEVKKEAPLPKIPGTVINRPNGTFLGLQVVS